MPKDKSSLPLLPLQEIVLFPGMSLPLYIFEEKYKLMISNCLSNSRKFGIVLAKGNSCAEVGTVAEILDVEKLEEDKMNVVAEGKSRFKILSLIKEEPYYIAEVTSYEDLETNVDVALEKTIKQIRKMSSKALNMFDKISEQKLAKKIKLPSKTDELLFLVAANLSCSFELKQAILETRSVKERAKKVLNLLDEEIQKLGVLLENKKFKDIVEKNGKLEI